MTIPERVYLGRNGRFYRNEAVAIQESGGILAEYVLNPPNGDEVEIDDHRNTG